MCVGAFISVCQQTETIVALYFYFYHVIAFVVVVDIMEKHLHLQKSNKQVPWYSHFGPLYSWKYHSNTMVCEAQYTLTKEYCAVPRYKNGIGWQYYGTWKCTLVPKFMYHGNTMVFLQVHDTSMIHVRNTMVVTNNMF